MKQEEKDLLLKDLSARLSYGVICNTPKGDGHLCSINQTIFGTEYGVNIQATKRDYFNDREVCIKPYLRPMSSMTSQEWCELCDCDTEDEKAAIFIKDGRRFVSHVNKETFLNSRHFDYRGLIEKGLALEAPEGMYNLNK